MEGIWYLAFHTQQKKETSTDRHFFLALALGVRFPVCIVPYDIGYPILDMGYYNYLCK